VSGVVQDWWNSLWFNRKRVTQDLVDEREVLFRAQQAIQYCERWKEEIIMGSARGDTLCTSINEAYLNGNSSSLVALAREHAVREGRLKE
jgi:hypothetical protein